MISVIVPVYNVEAFLEPCVRSIIGQTYRRLEIILVDDGSPDNCPQLCEQWAQKDERIRVLHKENGGLSDARNAGLKAATGEFVLFVDSDDWIAPEMAEKMLDAMVEYKADMVLCQYTEVFPNGKMLRKYDGKRAVRVYGRQEMFKLLLEDLEVTNHVWRRLYKRKLLPENLFPVGKNFEDMYVMAELTEKCETFVSLNDVYYYYRANPDGIMKTKTSKNLNDYLDALEKSHADICRLPGDAESNAGQYVPDARPDSNLSVGRCTGGADIDFRRKKADSGESGQVGRYTAGRSARIQCETADILQVVSGK